MEGKFTLPDTISPNAADLITQLLQVATLTIMLNQAMLVVVCNSLHDSNVTAGVSFGSELWTL